MWRSVLRAVTFLLMIANFVTVVLLIGAMAVAQERGDGDEVYPPEGTEAVGITPLPEPVLEIGLEHYWTMGEATGVTRADSVGSNDLTVTTGPATQIAAHLGNGVVDSELDMTSGPTVGVDGYTFCWWQEAQAAGSPTISSIWSLGGQGSLVSLSDATISIQVSINGRPGGAAATETHDLSIAPESYHFLCVVVDAAGITYYAGSDQGETLVVLTDTFDGGDTFVAPTAWNMDQSQGNSMELDDMAWYSRPLNATEVGLLYNGGAGEPLF